ncbi:hypothetical protein [Methylobacterium gnaphalii]|uniref:DUF1508 domain-containing protein n=1 Tax=Methylobacterium gnaphalii TaxID=1010610 RepID=A0A512JNG6_9HYPH|nr:hypothetical protein [Methylobacterium gnaphalii]GEP11507.1 hypothetical protein MGN01_33520 [Methylobacterium gnaphalii]GJD70160.1 hypothetical protein MMMDOFMJ_3102 [Methylobacterium gnaphalii]GLS49511.1 hypothetical protein GCM10007885_23600 [Methylobacterium gnaphalii]
MAAEFAAPLVLQVEPCKDDPSRFRWIIRDRDHVFRQSCYSLASEEEARTEGSAALREAAALLRDSC